MKRGAMCIFWGAASTRGDCKWGELSHHMLHIVRNWMTRGFRLCFECCRRKRRKARTCQSNDNVFPCAKKETDNFSEIYLQFSFDGSWVEWVEKLDPAQHFYIFLPGRGAGTWPHSQESNSWMQRHQWKQSLSVLMSMQDVSWSRLSTTASHVARASNPRRPHVLVPVAAHSSFLLQNWWKMVQCLQFLPLHFIWSITSSPNIPGFRPACEEQKALAGGTVCPLND